MTRTVLEGRFFTRIALFAVICAAGAAGCGGDDGRGPADDAWAYTQRDVVGPNGQGTTDSIRADVYVDATTSMVGYLAGGASRYTRFFRELESSLASGWAYSNLGYFKFGSRVRSISRNTFRDADRRAFYRESGVSQTTRIDSVLEQMNRSKISIITTDLFQNESDVTALVSRVKTEVFQQGLSAAVLGVRSEFDGRVFDARVPAYDYASTRGEKDTYRPFYALMFGKVAELRRLFQTLQSSPAVSRDYFVLISPYLVEDYRASVRKTRESRKLNATAVQEDDSRFAFDLQSGGTGGTLRANIVLDRAPNTPRIEANRVEMTAYRKKLSRRPGEGDTTSTRTRDLTLEALRSSEDTLRATLRMNLEDDPSGTYSYKTVFRPGATDGLGVPTWVERFSSKSPSPQNGPNKTLNLEKFISDLIQASNSVRRPKLAKLYITVRKL